MTRTLTACIALSAAASNYAILALSTGNPTLEGHGGLYVATWASLTVFTYTVVKELLRND